MEERLVRSREVGWREYLNADRAWVYEQHIAHYCWGLGFSAQFGAALEAALNMVDQTAKHSASDYRIVSDAAEERLGSIFLTPESYCTARIRLFYLSPHVRGLGHARTILSDVIKTANLKGLLTIKVSTYLLHHEACHLYHRFGFTELERKPVTAYGIKTSQINFEWNAR